MEATKTRGYRNVFFTLNEIELKCICLPIRILHLRHLSQLGSDKHLEVLLFFFFLTRLRIGHTQVSKTLHLIGTGNHPTGHCNPYQQNETV